MSFEQEATPEQIKDSILSRLKELRALTNDKPTEEQSHDFAIKNDYKYVANFFTAVRMYLEMAINAELISDKQVGIDAFKFIKFCEDDLSPRGGFREPITDEDVKKADKILDECIADLSK